MSNLLSILSWSGTSLGAQQGLVGTASNNVSNANTPGYARQVANLETTAAVTLGGIDFGSGANLASVTQARDRFLEAQIPGALASSARSSAESDALSSVSVLDPDATDGLAANLGSLYSALRQLAQDPSDSSVRASVVGTLQGFANKMNTTASALASARGGLDTQVASTADQVNPLAQQLASLNRQIAVARGAGGNPNDLLDARQKLQDQLVSLTGATVVPDGAGNVNLQLPNGTSLVNGDQAAKLSTTADPANGGHLQLQVTGADGSGPTAVAQIGGTLGGLVAARDGALKTAQAQLDSLAYDVATKLNTVHAAGFALDGSTGRALFNVSATATGAAASLSVNAAIVANPGLLAAASTAAGAPGDATNAQALVNTETAALSSGADATATLASIISGFGAASQSASASSTQDAAISDHLQQMRESASGVSIDEEMVKLTQAQRGYEAIGKVITTTNQMLETLMGIVGGN